MEPRPRFGESVGVQLTLLLILGAMNAVAAAPGGATSASLPTQSRTPRIRHDLPPQSTLPSPVRPTGGVQQSLAEAAPVRSSQDPIPDRAQAGSSLKPLEDEERKNVSSKERGTEAKLPVGTAVTMPSAPTAMVIDTTLIPGRKIEPIDLISVLRLAGERDLNIAIARQKINQSLAELERTRSLWLPSLFLGPTYYRADGQVQTVTGQVINVNRSSLFLGGTAALPNGFPAPSAGTGYPQLNSLSSVLRISDMIFEPLAARRIVAANQAGLMSRTNDALLEVAEAYLDLQIASGRLAIAREAAAKAEHLAKITEAYAKEGQGTEADHRRALAEQRHQRKNIQSASGQLLVASTNLTRLLVLDTRLVVAPIEPAEATLCLISEDIPLDNLIIEALQHRPELAQSRELVQAAIIRLKQAKLRPFIPSVSATYAGGGMGGGQGGFFGDFGARGDFMASIFWELQHLGFADRAIMRRNAAEKRTADLELLQIETRVAADVASAYEQRIAASRQIAESRETVSEAIESLKLNRLNMQEGAGLPRATRPIEVLQPIQALAQARLDYLDSVIAYNRAQFRLKRAIGQQP